MEFATENWTKHSHELNPFGAIELTIPDIATVEVLVTVLGRKVMAKVFERFYKTSTYPLNLLHIILFKADQRFEGKQQRYAGSFSVERRQKDSQVRRGEGGR